MFIFSIILGSIIGIVLGVLSVRSRNKEEFRKEELNKNAKIHELNTLGFSIGNINLTDKKKVNNLIGKSSFWHPQKIVGLCEYLAGIESIDEIIRQQNFFNSKPLVNFTIHENGLEITIMHNFKLHHLALKNIEINSIFLKQGNTTYLDGNSHIKRAIYGGCLFGPIGALLGGLSGIHKDSISEPDYLIITVICENRIQSILFKIKNRKTIKVAPFFKENYPGLLQIR